MCAPQLKIEDLKELIEDEYCLLEGESNSLIIHDILIYTNKPSSQPSTVAIKIMHVSYSTPVT